MTTPFLPLTRSTEMPLVTTWMNEALEALSDETHLDFLLFRTSIATRQALWDGRIIDTGSTVKALQKEEELYTRLMLAIPRPVARSLVRHTVAYDSVSSAALGEPLYTYSGRHKGVYVASMAILGRGGKFLTKSELEELIRRLQEYIRAVKVYLKDGAVWKSAADRKVVADVDTMFRVNVAIPGLRWGVTKLNLPKFEALVKMLERYRWNIAADGIPMKQCPLMVGCSQNAVKDRCHSHTPESGMSGTTATWGLTLCLIKAMGLTPEVRTFSVLTTVEKAELPAAEKLVTALAESLVTQHGFNMVEGGGSPDNSTSPNGYAKRHVYGEMSWLSDHAESVVNEARRRIALSDATSKKHSMFPGLALDVIRRIKSPKKKTSVEEVLVRVGQLRKELSEAELAVMSQQRLRSDDPAQAKTQIQDGADDLEEIGFLLGALLRE